MKKAGNKDVTRVVEKVQVKLNDAKGKASDVDWKSLAQELKVELGPTAQQAIDVSFTLSNGTTIMTDC